MISKFLKPLNQKGFTIIELIVVFSVIAILSSIGVAASVNYSRAQSLEAATQDLKTVLNQAKSYAQSQYKPSSRCDEDQVLQKFRVELRIGKNDYSLSVFCGDDDVKLSSFVLPKDVSFEDSDSPSEFFDFPIISGGIQGDGQSPSPWEIKLVGLDERYKIITIDTSGSIR